MSFSLYVTEFKTKRSGWRYFETDTSKRAAAFSRRVARTIKDIEVRTRLYVPERT